MILEKETSIYDNQKLLTDGRKEATNYLYYDANNGLVVSRNHAVANQTDLNALTDGNIRLTGEGLNIYHGQTRIAKYGDTAIIGEETSYNTYITDSGVTIRNGNTPLSTYTGDSIVLGNSEADTFYSTIANGGFNIYAKIGSTNTNIFHVGLASSNDDYAYTQKTYTDVVGQYDYDKHVIYDYFTTETNLNSVKGTLSNGQTVDISSDTAAVTHYTWTYKLRNGNIPDQYELAITYYQPMSGAYYVSFTANIASTDGTTTIGTYYTLGTREPSSINGAFSVAGGKLCMAEGQYSVAFGDRCRALASSSFVAGSDCQSSGKLGFLFGKGLQSLSGYQFVVGQYNYAPSHNVIWLPSFVVGNGTASSDGESVSQSDAFWVQPTGDVGLTGSLKHCGPSPFAVGSDLPSFYLYNDGLTTGNTQVLASTSNRNYFGNPSTATTLQSSYGSFALNDLIYNTGTATVTLRGFGWVTSSSQQLYMIVFTPKMFLAHSTVEVTAVKSANIRPVGGGYLGGSGSDLTQYISSSSGGKPNMIMCTLVKSDGWGATNNSPIVVQASFTFKVS